jgi:hypothetical protein
MSEPLIPYGIRKNWKDGNLAPDFRKYGYPDPLWRAGFMRKIPRELAQRAEEAGALLMVPSLVTPEDLRPTARPSVTLTEAEAEKAAAERLGKDPLQKVLFEKNWTDGGLAHEFAGALNHPPHFWEGEVVRMPRSLVETCKAHGAPINTNAGAIEDAESGNQLKFRVRVEKWRAEHQAARDQTEAGKANESHNARINAEIEKLAGRTFKATGKTREALWARIDQLYKELR